MLLRPCLPSESLLLSAWTRCLYTVARFPCWTGCRCSGTDSPTASAARGRARGRRQAHTGRTHTRPCRSDEIYFSYVLLPPPPPPPPLSFTTTTAITTTTTTTTTVNKGIILCGCLCMFCYQFHVFCHVIL